MPEETLKVFVEGATNYFKNASNDAVKVGVPYLIENTAPKVFDFTGIIGVSGPYRGTVYFTAPKIMLKHLLISLGETDTSLENILDLVGEVANTISGNARSMFGHEFMISVPVMIDGIPNSIHLPPGLRS